MGSTHVFLTNFAVVLLVAGVTTALFQKLRLPVIFGYMLAGLLIGPHFPFFPIVAEEPLVEALSELGVILLIFALGLEFSLRRLARTLSTTGLIAFAQSSLLILLGYTAGRLFGWSDMEAVYAGAVLAISSTTIIIKAFEEQKVKGRFVDIVFGVLIVEDLIGILLLALLTTATTAGEFSAAQLAATATRLLVFLALFIVIGLLTIPRLMRWLVKLDRSETVVVASAGLAFGAALIADRFGYSVALGAFLAGAIAAESGVAKKVEHLLQPVRDLFAAVFFVAVGMLINPALIAEHWLAVVVLTGVVVFGKVVGVTISSFLTGYDVRTSVQAGMSLAQIGEFSFIIASVGLAAGAIRPFLYPVAIAVSAITTLITPILIRSSDRAATFIDRKLPRPLQTFVALYGTWIERLRRTPEHTTGYSIRRLLGLLVVDAVLLAIIVVGTSLEMARLTEFTSDLFQITPTIARAIIALITAALAAPLMYGLVRTTRFIALALAYRAFPQDLGLDYAAAARRAFITVVQLGVIGLAGVALLVITLPFVPAFGSVALFVAALLTFAFGFWRSAANLHGHAQAGAQLLASALAERLPEQPGSLATPDLTAASTLLEGLGDPSAVRIGAGATAIGKSLAELNLRALTGATVLAIRHNSTEVLLPNGREVLQEGDVLAIGGTAVSVRRARQILMQGAIHTGQSTPHEPV